MARCFVDQQIQIRKGSRKNGRWHLTVDQAGTYQFELCRWPRESGLAVNEGCDSIKVTDGRYPEGESLKIKSAKLNIRSGESNCFPATLLLMVPTSHSRFDVSCQPEILN